MSRLDEELAQAADEEARAGVETAGAMVEGTRAREDGAAEHGAAEHGAGGVDAGRAQPGEAGRPTATGGSHTNPAAAITPPRRSLGLLLTLLVMGTSLVVLMLTSFRSAVVYSKGVEELLAERERLAGRAVRVEGTLVKGTLTRREDPCEYRFTMERGGQRLNVEYPHCSIPDTFRDVGYTDVMVTAEGRLGPDGRFLATQIMAKCPSKYEEQTKQRANATRMPAPRPPSAESAESAKSAVD